MAVGFAWPGTSDQAAATEAVQAIGFEAPGQEDGYLDLPSAKPGFRLNLAEEDLQKQMARLNGFFEKTDWAKAFRLLTELGDEQLQVMVPMSDQGHHVLVKEELQQQLLSLPPDGRRAFRLYFDSQASEQFEKVKNHPLPGSDEQLLQAQTLVDRLLASSVGGEAAVLLGDMYFERGLFEQAERNWRLALAEGSATGQAALELEAKRALAMQRGGKPEQALALFNGLSARYGQAKMQAGGKEIDALALLGQTIDQNAQTVPADESAALPDNLLPAQDAMPHWHVPFLDTPTQNAVNQVRGRNSYYSPPTDIVKFVPPVVADGQRVYFQWLGVVFALDRQNGRVVWNDGVMSEAANLATMRAQSNHGDPRNYRIAVADGAVLVTTPQNNGQNSAFVLKAYDAENGQVRWSSDTRQDWTIEDRDNPQQDATSVLGQVLVTGNSAYAVVCRSGDKNLLLRRFAPTTGEVQWTIPLGTAEAITFQYTQVSRVPQPTLMMGPSLLYVMANNGAILAVDVIASEVKWALRIDPPFGIGHRQGNNFMRGNQLGNQLEAMANTNGADSIFIQDGTLYAKEHNGKSLYAMDPATGKIKWSADQLKPDAKLIGIDDKRFYLMDRSIQSYHTEGNHDLITKNGAQTGSPDHAGTVLNGDKILFYANGKLRQFDTTHLDRAGKYENTDYLGQKGGHLYVLDDLLVAIDATQITAFKIPENNE
ncbi:MAG: PQQ-like beta-propeller repeat protein [Phycisphaeraceae bacterium]|nr:PQQ-like beta-propeller repeat protein [Phycisphaeraceae bacterium]